MVDALKDDLDLKKMEENTSDFYSLLDAMAFLINVIVFRKSEEMICERYNDNFVSTREQIDVLYQWGSNILDTFQPHNVENQDPILVSIFTSSMSVRIICTIAGRMIIAKRMQHKARSKPPLSFIIQDFFIIFLNLSLIL